MPDVTFTPAQVQEIDRRIAAAAASLQTNQDGSSALMQVALSGLQLRLEVLEQQLRAPLA